MSGPAHDFINSGWVFKLNKSKPPRVERSKRLLPVIPLYIPVSLHLWRLCLISHHDAVSHYTKLLEIRLHSSCGKRLEVYRQPLYGRLSPPGRAAPFGVLSLVSQLSPPTKIFLQDRETLSRSGTWWHKMAAILTQVHILLVPVLPLLQFCALDVRKKRVTGKRDELATYEKYYLLYYSYLAYDYCRTKPRPFTRIYESAPKQPCHDI